MSTTQTIAVNIGDFLREDMPVFDRSSERIGTVQAVNNEAGYFMVEMGIINHTHLYIPFRVIYTIDPKEVFLRQGKDALFSEFTNPPQATTITQTHNGHEENIQVMGGGFDGRPVVVRRVDVQAVGQQLVVGMDVYDAESSYVGQLTQYDVPKGVIVVEKGLFSPEDLFIPFTLIGQVYPSDNNLMLTLPKDALTKDIGRYTSPSQHS